MSSVWKVESATFSQARRRIYLSLPLLRNNLRTPQLRQKSIKLQNISTSDETLVCIAWFQGRQCTRIMLRRTCDQSPWLQPYSLPRNSRAERGMCHSRQSHWMKSPSEDMQAHAASRGQATLLRFRDFFQILRLMEQTCSKERPWRFSRRCHVDLRKSRESPMYLG